MPGPTIGYCFLIYENVIPFFEHIIFTGNPKTDQLKKILKRSYLLQSVIYSVIGLITYYSLGKNVTTLSVIAITSSLPFFIKYFIQIGVSFSLAAITYQFVFSLQTVFNNYLLNNIRNTAYYVGSITLIVYIVLAQLILSESNLFYFVCSIGIFPGLILQVIFPCLMSFKIQYSRSLIIRILIGAVMALAIVLILVSIGVTIAKNKN